MTQKSKCDICNLQTNNLSDYFCMICPKCKKKYSNNTQLLLRIGTLMNKLEELENLKKAIRKIKII